MLRYKGVLNMKGTDRKVIFQGVHQLMGSDLGPQWAEGEARVSKMVFIGIDLPQDIFRQGLDQSLVRGRFPWGNTGVCCICNVFVCGGAGRYNRAPVKPRKACHPSLTAPAAGACPYSEETRK